MRRRVGVVGLMLVALVALAPLGAQKSPAATNAAATGWQLPPTAEDEKSPLRVTPAVLNTGKSLYQKQCQRCHGEQGIGDGPDADPDYMADMDLTHPKRADRNPDGVVFYKVWNGRTKPKMPALKDELTKEQVWAIVAYVQTLRKPS